MLSCSVVQSKQIFGVGGCVENVAYKSENLFRSEVSFSLLFVRTKFNFEKQRLKYHVMRGMVTFYMNRS